MRGIFTGVAHRELCLEDIASTESDELECRYRQEFPEFAKYVSAITLATNLSVTLIIIINVTDKLVAKLINSYI